MSLKYTHLLPLSCDIKDTQCVLWLGLGQRSLRGLVYIHPGTFIGDGTLQQAQIPQHHSLAGLRKILEGL